MQLLARAWRRVAPWLTPALVALEIALVWSGVLSVRNAVVIILVVEVLLACTVLSRVIVALRRFRRVRSAGSGVWWAAEDALAELLPRPAARVLLIEARMWVCLLQWIGRRRPTSHSYGYGRSLRALLWTLLLCGLVEGMVVELVLAATLGHASPWVWVTLGLHAYALVWIGGFLGSLQVLPHELDGASLRLRDSVFTTVTVPLAAIASATKHHRSNLGRSGWKIDDGIGLLAYGDAAVRIRLVPDHGVELGQNPEPRQLNAIDLTVDNPDEFVETLRAHQPAR